MGIAKGLIVISSMKFYVQGGQISNHLKFHASNRWEKRPKVGVNSPRARVVCVLVVSRFVVELVP